MKDRLGEKIMIKFVGVGAKIYSYLIDNGSEDKKNKDTKTCVIKKNFLEKTQLENELNYLEKN